MRDPRCGRGAGVDDRAGAISEARSRAVRRGDAGDRDDVHVEHGATRRRVAPTSPLAPMPALFITMSIPPSGPRRSRWRRDGGVVGDVGYDRVKVGTLSGDTVTRCLEGFDSVGAVQHGDLGAAGGQRPRRGQPDPGGPPVTSAASPSNSVDRIVIGPMYHTWFLGRPSDPPTTGMEPKRSFRDRMREIVTASRPTAASLAQLGSTGQALLARPRCGGVPGKRVADLELIAAHARVIDFQRPPVRAARQAHDPHQRHPGSQAKPAGLCA